MDLGKIDDEDIVLVEFIRDDKDKWIPWSIQTKDPYINDYDIEYSKGYERFYYSCSAGGGDLAVEQPKGFYIKEDLIDQCVGFEQYKETRLLEFPFTQEEWAEWLEDVVEGETVYCSECDDRWSTERYPEPCEHVWWCDECGWWSVPDERCDHPKED